MLIQFQGYTIQAPDPPSEPGDFLDHPTAVQVVSQVDQQVVHSYPPSMDILLGETPANELVWGTVTFQCYWDTIFNAIAQDSQVQESVAFTVGVTTSDSETTSFGMTFGIEAPILPGIKAALSATFSQSETHSVAVSESQTITHTFTAVPGTTLQVWQLHAQYIVEYEKDGQTYRHVLSNDGSPADGVVLALTYPVAAVAVT